MIPKIPLSALYRSVHGHMYGEASAAGLLPGSWPQLLGVVEENLRDGIYVTNVYRRDRALHGGEQEATFAGYSYVADGLPGLYLLDD